MTPARLAEIRHLADASTFRALVALVRRETAARLADLRSRQAFGHAIDDIELGRLVDRGNTIAAEYPA